MMQSPSPSTKANEMESPNLEIASSLNTPIVTLVDEPVQPSIKKIDYSNNVLPKVSSAINHEKEKPISLFYEIGLVMMISRIRQDFAPGSRLSALD